MSKPKFSGKDLRSMVDNMFSGVDTRAIDQQIEALLQEKQRALMTASVPTFRVDPETGSRAAAETHAQEEMRRRAARLSERFGPNTALDMLRREFVEVRLPRGGRDPLRFMLARRGDTVLVMDEKSGEFVDVDRVAAGAIRDLLEANHELDMKFRDSKGRALELSCRLDALEARTAARDVAELRLDDEVHLIGCEPDKYNGCVEGCPTVAAERALDSQD